MDPALADTLDRIVDETGFSGVVEVTRPGTTLYRRAAGMADRAHGIANTVDTRFAIASGAKTLTALAVMALVGDGALTLDARVRDVVTAPELEAIDPAVTVGHLLAHTSGIGDYLPEEGDIDEHALPVPVHRLERPTDFLAVLAGHPTRFPPGERFEYCNGGYVVLALVIEAAAGGEGYHDLVDRRVCGPAGLAATAFLRLDDLPGDAAIGYLGNGRTNHLHMPVRGLGDGGAYSTAADVATFWDALFAGRILPPAVVDEMVRAHNDAPAESLRYGLGFWLRPDRDTVMLEGYDAGVSFRAAHDRSSGLRYTVLANTAEGAWPLVRAIDEALPTLADG